jgi:ribonucleotide monophosphatase NagD (HAD superfamily)
MTTGAWLHCLRSLFANYCSSPLEAVLAGKPHAPIYRRAVSLLGPCGPVFCVGDNPAADMRGALNSGFVGVLVLSGCATHNDPAHPALLVARDVAEALELILAHE